jgi:capsule biosynthesis phosphatase
MKRLVFDLDGTLTYDQPAIPYPDKLPRLDIVEMLRRYRQEGFTIIIASSRNMRTCGNSVGLINARTLPVIFEWLARHDIPFDEIHIGKPWCGEEGFYIDDKAIRPSELSSLSHPQILELLERERAVPAEGPNG